MPDACYRAAINTSPSFCSPSDRTLTRLNDLERLTGATFKPKCAAARAEGGHHHVHANAPLAHGLEL
jgi:hypothetical protein